MIKFILRLINNPSQIHSSSIKKIKAYCITICILKKFRQNILKSQMNIQKAQAIQKLVIQQSGQSTLLLNDFVMGYEGVRIVASMIGEYHSGLEHLEIKGNNLDGESFQMLFSALVHCTYLKSIVAEWNSIGDGERGLMALVKLVNSLNYLELIDLKNNRISHHLSSYIAEVISSNRKHLKVIDLRWNELGEIGGEIIARSIAQNQWIKFVGLEDNQISARLLSEIDKMLKRQSKLFQKQQNSGVLNEYYPITGTDYPSMDSQLKTAQVRNKIDQEQRQAEFTNQRIQAEIEKALNSVKLKVASINQLKLKNQSLKNQHHHLVDQLRNQEHLLSIQKQKVLGIESSLGDEKNSIRIQKHNFKTAFHDKIEQKAIKSQKDLEQLDTVMGNKLEKLKIYLRERLKEKQANREKLTQIRQDMIKYKMGKEQTWNRLGTGKGNFAISLTQNCIKAEDMAANVKVSLSTEQKKGEYLSEQLMGTVTRALRKEDKREDDIFHLQKKIKTLHHEMTITNLDIQQNSITLKTLDSHSLDHNLHISILQTYLKFLETQSSLNVEIEGLKFDQHHKSKRLRQENLQLRIQDIERAIRAQVAQNKLIRNHYEKLRGESELATKTKIQSVLFE